MLRAGMRLDMQNSSQERRRNSAGGLAQQRAATTQTPRRPIGAGGVRGAGRSGSASVITPHALFARPVQRKLSIGVAGFAAGGSSSDRKRSRPIAFSATPHDGQRPCRTLAEDPGRTQPRAAYPGAAAQTRVVSMAGIRLGSWESARAFKGIICDESLQDMSGFHLNALEDAREARAH